MSLKSILFLTTIFSFISLLPTTVAAAEPSAEPNPRPLGELAKAFEQINTGEGAFIRDNPTIIIIDLSELMAKDHWEPIPIDPEQFERFTQVLADIMDFRAAHSTLPPNAFAEATAVEPLADPNNPEIPPVDILIVIDNSPSMRRNRELPIMDPEELPMSPEQRRQWENFKQTVANMSFDKVSIRIRFSLNEDGQLMCWHSIHGSLPFDCEEMINRMFSWIEKAEEQGSLIVSNTEPLIQDFILGHLRQIEPAEKMSARLEQFMKDHELSGWAITITSHNRIAETQDQASE